MAPKLCVYVSADVATHEAMRFALKEIVRRSEADPFGFKGEEAAAIARQSLQSVDAVEQRANA